MGEQPDDPVQGQARGPADKKLISKSILNMMRKTLFKNHCFKAKKFAEIFA